uniref:VOC family protein n=1 Tax=Thaumasiovibrio subtropicus TaxID=1891207 RepID=UPI000B35FA91|nr:VOC family protein [Thaumasiovibrio subtropicus]
MITGLNHLTLAVSSLEASLDFYVDKLGLCLHATWDNGAYLSAGDLWFCLSVDAAKPARDYSRILKSPEDTCSARISRLAIEALL